MIDDEFDQIVEAAWGSGRTGQTDLGYALEDLVRGEVRTKMRGATSALEFVDAGIMGGLPADVGRPLTFEGRRFWRPIYEAMSQPAFCVMSAAQVGKTIMLLTGLGAVAHLFHNRGKGVWHGLYMPTREMVSVFSKGRLDPILTAMGELSGLRCGAFVPQTKARTEEKGPGKRALDAYNFKTIGDDNQKSHVYLAWMQGKLVDALPLDIVWLDEVRLMDPDRVDRVEKRVQGSEFGWVGYTSTAGLPGDAIAVRFEQSDQQHWHHPCACSGGVELASTWPNCLGVRKGREARLKGKFFLHCPRCGTEIKDRSAGRWVPHNEEDGLYPGFTPNQLMTQQPLERIVRQSARSDRTTTEFFNSVLGRAYLDAEACPITEEVVKASENPDLLWARPGDVSRTAIGIDQMGGVNYYVISQNVDGHRRLVHLEINWDLDPFQRAAELMREYDGAICCLEPLPNFNDAIQFANAFRGRAFLVTYRNMTDGQMVWGDVQGEAAGKKLVGPEFKTRSWLAMDQTKCLDALTHHWKARRVECPNSRDLRQRVKHEHGGDFMVDLCYEVYWDHMQRIARRRRTETRTADGVEIAEQTGRVDYHWVKLARAPSGKKRAPVKGATSDPHFAFADLMNWAAWTRLAASGGNWKPSVMWF